MPTSPKKTPAAKAPAAAKTAAAKTPAAEAPAAKTPAAKTPAPRKKPAPRKGAAAATTPAVVEAPAVSTPSEEELDRLVGGAHHDPHGILGAHELSSAPTTRTVVRTLRPDAESAVVVMGGTRVDMTRIHDGGVFEAHLDEPATDYRIEVGYAGGSSFTVDDPYRWLPTLGEIDLHLIGEGRHENLWDVLGAHVRSYDTPGGTISGTSFAVWAPNARGVRVTGEFDYWSGRGLPMRVLGSSGVWELFVPGVGDGASYKFQVLGADGVWRHKADPMAFATEVPPATASVVHTPNYEWRDAEWMARRERTSWHKAPISIYEVHIGSWRMGLSYRDLARELVDYVVETGFTHVEFLPVAEHPFGGSWGYQVSSYYAPSARFGSPDELRYLIDELHNAGIGVLVDWVPAHFPKDEFALGRFDGTPLYEHGDPRRGEQLDWGTYVFDFGRSEVRNFLVANALFWLEQFHVDGLRVDAVASMLYLDYSRAEGQWLPNIYGGRENLDAVAFLQEMNATVYKRVPGVVTIAEESTSWPGVTRPTHLGGLGFGFKWDMGWMHDTLSYIAHEPVHRQWHHNELTFSMMYAYTENFVMPISHDEVVHGKGSLLNKIPGDRWQQMATLRTLFAYMWAHPGKQLLFMGQEFGQSREWSESRSLDWELTDDPGHRGLLRLITDLNHVYRDTDALWSRDTVESGFHWIDANDAAGNVFSFVRFGEAGHGNGGEAGHGNGGEAGHGNGGEAGHGNGGEAGHGNGGDDGSVLACVANFSSVPHEQYRLGLPFAGRWDEIVNTDADVYFGSGVGNFGGVQADDQMWHGQPASALLRVPPLGALWLRYRPAEQNLGPNAL